MEEAPERIVLPRYFGFHRGGVVDFDQVVGLFDWGATRRKVQIDLSGCVGANYQALSLFGLYIWHLSIASCRVEIKLGETSSVTTMWRRMGLPGWSQVLYQEKNFKAHRFKPLIDLRSSKDFQRALIAAEEFSRGFNVEYEKTLRYVVSELLYNTLEHGRCFRRARQVEIRVPSIVQFTWYKKRDELQFLIADLGVGVKTHLEQAYPSFDSDEAAIRASLKPRVSGTFGQFSPYESKNNAGVGLYLSSNIVRRLRADMYICSGNGLVHISPRDTTSSTLSSSWPGTFVLVSVRLGQVPDFRLHDMMQEFRAAADEEIKQADKDEDAERVYVNVQNYFGPFAEDKESAIRFRDKYLVPAADQGRPVLFDFRGVESSPHSFLSALLADPVRRLGIQAYKLVKFVNTDPAIRETIDFILDENTVPRE